MKTRYLLAVSVAALVLTLSPAARGDDQQTADTDKSVKEKAKDVGHAVARDARGRRHDRRPRLESGGTCCGREIARGRCGHRPGLKEAGHAIARDSKKVGAAVAHGAKAVGTAVKRDAKKVKAAATRKSGDTKPTQGDTKPAQ